MTDDQIEEMEFLRFFYTAVRPALGPADDDIVQMIKEDFEDEYGFIPKGYGRDD